MIEFSVLLPSYNRRETLARVLQAWEQQEPRDLCFELIVVDDGSSDGTGELLASWQSQRFALRFAVQANAGPAAARNRAAQMARGRYLLFTGDDIEPTPSLLADHLAAHTRAASPTRAILGLTQWPPGAEITATMRHIDGPGAEQFSYHYLVDGQTYDFRHFYTSNVSLERALTLHEPGFSEDFAFAAFEDAEYAYRLTAHGLEIVYHAAAVAYHHHPYAARGFYRRQQRCGAMAAVLYRKHPALQKWLAIRELDRTRLGLLAYPPKHRQLAASAELELRRERAILLAERLDAVDPPGIDPYLSVLFRCGYEDGLAHALFPPEEAARIWLARSPALGLAAQQLGVLAEPLGLNLPAYDLDLLSRPY